MSGENNIVTSAERVLFSPVTPRSYRTRRGQGFIGGFERETMCRSDPRAEQTVDPIPARADAAARIAHHTADHTADHAPTAQLCTGRNRRLHWSVVVEICHHFVCPFRAKPSA